MKLRNEHSIERMHSVLLFEHDTETKRNAIVRKRAQKTKIKTNYKSLTNKQKNSDVNAVYTCIALKMYCEDGGDLLSANAMKQTQWK